MKSNKKRYIWECNCSDTCYHTISQQTFESKEECYNDMRNAALNKMKWNTEYREDFDESMVDGVVVPSETEDNCIEYGVKFFPHKIIHSSYSGIYTYEIKEEREDIFEGAKFGIMYRTTDKNKKAIFVGRDENVISMLIDGRLFVSYFNKDGSPLIKGEVSITEKV